jgi:hypothetical protein
MVPIEYYTQCFARRWMTYQGKRATDKQHQRDYSHVERRKSADHGVELSFDYGVHAQHAIDTLDNRDHWACRVRVRVKVRV